jgi:very-long-chain enoyl-CoA reductase
MTTDKLCYLAGPQIGWRTCYLIEYIGPLLIHPLMYLLRTYLYSTTKARSSFPPPSALQTLSLLLICIHFAKRVYETVFVHRFSAATMPFFNVFKNSAHYWLLAGVNLAYWIYSPSGPTANSANPLLTYPGLLLYCVGQFGTLNTHLTLRGLRTAGGKERGIPHGLGFNLVTCPNYMFETMVWVGMCLITRSLATVLFSIVGVVQMALWAKKKEKTYRREFGDKYTSKRYCIIPGIY